MSGLNDELKKDEVDKTLEPEQVEAKLQELDTLLAQNMAPTPQCLPVRTLRAVACGMLPPLQGQEAHLAGCDHCTKQVKFGRDWIKKQPPV